MHKHQTYICLYQEHVPDLQECLLESNRKGYDIIVTPIVSPIFHREFIEMPMKVRHLPFTRSDLILTSSQWLHHIIAKINDNIDCDSDDEKVRKHSEKTLMQEISYAQYLIQYGFMIYKLKGIKCVNLARLISQYIKGTFLIEVPMIDPKSLAKRWRRSRDDNEIAEDTWTWWNRFRSCADFDMRIKVVLEMCGEETLSQEQIDRWLGEPVECLIIPSHIFVRDEQNKLVLSKNHQEMIGAFLKNDVHFMVKCNLNDANIKHYSEYLKHLVSNYNMQRDPLEGCDDSVEVPLQPLYNNIDSYTYEVLESDPVKYNLYQQAIEQALIDLVDENEISNKTIIIMVVGAGRGPLVRCALNAATNTGRKIKLYVIEKNPNAFNTLTALIEEMWSDKGIELISGDMRNFVPPEKADILVSELLGSFGDNELSPECLDGAQKHLKDTGISIPSKSTSYINPLMSSKIYNLVRNFEKSYRNKIRESPKIYAGENTYIVYIKNAYHIDRPKPVFEFIHPNRSECIDNSRFKSLQFHVTIDCILNGFAGYFDAILYKDVKLSIHPESHTNGLQTWCSIYFPLVEPQQLKAGDTIEVNFWRCLTTHKVWYEWSTTSPHVTHIHNHTGRSCPIYL